MAETPDQAEILSKDLIIIIIIHLFYIGAFQGSQGRRTNTQKTRYTIHNTSIRNINKTMQYINQ